MIQILVHMGATPDFASWFFFLYFNSKIQQIFVTGSDLIVNGGQCRLIYLVLGTNRLCVWYSPKWTTKGGSDYWFSSWNCSRTQTTNLSFADILILFTLISVQASAIHCYSIPTTSCLTISVSVLLLLSCSLMFSMYIKIKDTKRTQIFYSVLGFYLLCIVSVSRK